MHDADSAFEADTAHDDVPNNEPVKLVPLIGNEAEIYTPPSIKVESPIVDVEINFAIVFVVPGPTVPCPPGAQAALVANEDVSAYEADVILPSTFCAVVAYDEVSAYQALARVNVILVAADDVVAELADVTELAETALFAQLLVPNNEPVNPLPAELPVRVNDPVI